MDDIVAVVTDLFFQSRIAATARAAGCSVRFIRDPQSLTGVESFKLALVDLDAGTFVLDAIADLKRDVSGTVVAFGPHVDTELRKAAKSAGADRVLAKSKFVTELPAIIAGGRE